MSSNPFRATASNPALISAKINLFAVTLDSSPIHSTNVLTIDWSESFKSSLLTGNIQHTFQFQS